MGIHNLIKDSLFPKYCFGCKKLGAYICPDCSCELMPVRKELCPYCKRNSFFGLTHPGCKRVYGIDGLMSIFYYTPLARKIIRRIKYQFVKEAISDILQSIPQERIHDLFFYKKIMKDFAIVPVPLHKIRKKQRGFNQAYEFGLFFANALRVEMLDSLVIRKKNTPMQTSLKRNRRHLSIKGAFALVENKEKDVKGKRFIVVDDVWTTGSTSKTVCQVLKRKGADKTFVLTIVR